METVLVQLDMPSLFCPTMAILMVAACIADLVKPLQKVATHLYGIKCELEQLRKK